MDRKNFLKNACGVGVCSCLGLNLFVSETLLAKGMKIDDSDKKTPVIPVDSRQMQNVLRFIDKNMDESIKKSIFERMGYEHTTEAGFIKTTEDFKKDLNKFFDSVNSNKDTYWEKMEYDPETSTIKITGKVVDRCACPFAQHDNPPKSLCNYCCINFQKCMFEMLLEREVKVKLDESYLLGGNRCSTTISFNGKLQLEKTK